jgi:hypothetical protein
MKKAVVCIVATQSQAEALVNDLETMGFPRVDISVLFPNRQDTRGFALENNTKAPEGAVAGVGAGGVVGGTLGLLAGIGALAIPGLGPLIAAGPLMAALSGAAAGAAVGGIAGALVGMGIPEYEAKTYEGKVKNGGILVAVHTDNAEERKRAEAIFRRRGAHDIATASEALRY